MAEWRIGRGWSEAELEDRLERSKSLRLNFTDPPDRMTLEHGWHHYYSEAVVARERPGSPMENGPFARGRIVVENYEFSDPRIVVAHFDPHEPLHERYMLLEMRALRILHYLGAVVVGAVRSEENDGKSVFGFRYDTLQGHIEEGAEWFLLTKDHAMGEIRLRIEAAWRPGQFPNWWSRTGFSWLGPYYQKKWHHHAHAIVAKLVRDPATSPPEPQEGRLVHITPDVTFKRFRPYMPHKTNSLAYAAGIGIIAGMRSMAAPALLSRQLAKAPPARAHGPAGLLSQRHVAGALTAMAAGEMVADKMPFIPDRTEPPSLVGRALSGAFSGAAIVDRRERWNLPAALVGATAAVCSTFLVARLRKAAGKATGLPDWIFGCVEDAVVLAAGSQLASLAVGARSTALPKARPVIEQEVNTVEEGGTVLNSEGK